MAATLVQQLYSQNHWASIDGVQTIWNFTFSGGYILPAHVKAYYLDASGTRVDVTVTEGMLTGEYQLTVSPALPASATRFVIYRDTPKDLPLVDFVGGANVTESNMDRAARQAVFCAAEVLDGASVSGVSLDSVLARLAVLENVALPALSELGFKAMKQNVYTGSSNVLTDDNGKAHKKLDGTSVSVPNTLPNEFLSTIMNYSASPMTVTFSSGTAIQQGVADTTAHATWTLAAWNTLTIVKVASGSWLIAGKAVQA